MAVVSFLKMVGLKLRAFALALGGPGLFLIAVADSSFVTIPEANDILIVVLSLGQSWSTMFYYVMMTTLGSVLGCYLLFSVGCKGGEIMLRKKFSQTKIDFARRMFAKSDILMVVIPCLLPPPMPFKIFVLSSGVFGLKPARFIVAVFLGRTIRYSMWGVLAVIYGESIRYFLEYHIYKIGVVILGVFLLVAAFIIGMRLRSNAQTRRRSVAPKNTGEVLKN
ncbi:MAG: VTT domain-containing protein [Acidobacteria bacterium]|nr:VTT domain-containing protein [Acidobacteriota bacterium]MBI3655459.1 VTT domain-containing protein [Acidobacteriota bacterium]